MRSCVGASTSAHTPGARRVHGEVVDALSHCSDQGPGRSPRSVGSLTSTLQRWYSRDGADRPGCAVNNSRVVGCCGRSRESMTVSAATSASPQVIFRTSSRAWRATAELAIVGVDPHQEGAAMIIGRSRGMVHVGGQDGPARHLAAHETPLGRPRAARRTTSRVISSGGRRASWVNRCARSRGAAGGCR